MLTMKWVLMFAFLSSCNKNELVVSVMTLVNTIWFIHL